MLNKLKNIKEHIAQGKNAITFDVSKFNDPVAEQVQWTSLISGGSNFTTHKLIEVNPDRFEFQTGLMSKLFQFIDNAFNFIFMGIGILVPVYVIFNVEYFANLDFILNDEVVEGPEVWQIIAASLVFGLIFIATGYFFSSSKELSTTTVIDKTIGKCWKGKDGPDVNPDLVNHDNVYDLRSVYALQLLPKYLSSNNSHFDTGSRSSFYVYELNFVFDDLKRVNVMSHGGKAALRKDAEKLAEFLGKPLWDALG